MKTSDWMQWVEVLKHLQYPRPPKTIQWPREAAHYYTGPGDDLGVLSPGFNSLQQDRDTPTPGTTSPPPPRSKPPDYLH